MNFLSFLIESTETDDPFGEIPQDPQSTDSKIHAKNAKEAADSFRHLYYDVVENIKKRWPGQVRTFYKDTTGLYVLSKSSGIGAVLNGQTKDDLDPRLLRDLRHLAKMAERMKYLESQKKAARSVRKADIRDVKADKAQAAANDKGVGVATTVPPLNIHIMSRGTVRATIKNAYYLGSRGAYSGAVKPELIAPAHLKTVLRLQRLGQAAGLRPGFRQYSSVMPDLELTFCICSSGREVVYVREPKSSATSYGNYIYIGGIRQTTAWFNKIDDATVIEMMKKTV